jgi:ankyrin repeat protein
MLDNYYFVHACCSGNYKNVKRLLNKGFDVHFNNDSGIECAIRNGNLKVIKLLLKHGAKIKHNYDFYIKSEIREFLDKKLLLDKLNEFR